MDFPYVTVPAGLPVDDAQRLVVQQDAQSVVVWAYGPVGSDADDENEDESDVVWYEFSGPAIAQLSPSTRPIGDVLDLSGLEPVARLNAPSTISKPAEIEAMVNDAVDRFARRGWTSAERPAIPPLGGDVSRGGAGGAGPQGSAPELSAYAVAVEYPRSVRLGDPLSLLISITADLANVDGIPFAGMAGEAIDVVVSPKAGFVVDGVGEARLTVGTPDSLPAQVRLKATAEGSGQIICYAFRTGTALGSLTITPEVVAAAGSGPSGLDSATGSLGSPPAGSSQADLELIVLQEQDRDGRPVLRYLLDATDPTLGLNLKPFGPVPITGGPAEFFFSLFADISSLPVATAGLRRIAAEKLTAIGSTLFTSLFPEDLQVLLWGLRSRISSVLIQSEEPWVPWELCRLQGREDGRVVEGPYLCEAFEITRWMPGLARRPRLTASSIGIIQPPSDLASAPKETAMLQGLAGAGRAVSRIPANYTAVRTALGEATYDTVHFVGHGRFPDPNEPLKAEISLTGTQTLRPIDISGQVTNLGLRSPIVFLNACQSGVKSVQLTGNGGWAVSMLKAGAGAFIGSHWDVTDSLALSFATEFYARLLAGDSVPAAVKAARLGIRDDGDPTWLAYTVYADPHAQLAR